MVTDEIICLKMVVTPEKNQKMTVTATGLEINGRKDAKCVCFFHIASDNCHGNDKKCVCIFQQV